MSFSCNKNKGLSQAQEAENLSEMLAKIKTTANSVACEDSSEWAYVSYGEKGCGGPVGYIAYSTTIDTVLFLKKVEEHRTAEKNFNVKWNVISDCSAPLEPTGVLCEGGKPVLQYD